MTLFFVSAISIATVLLYGCVGEIITEKAGHLNLGPYPCRIQPKTP